MRTINFIVLGCGILLCCSCEILNIAQLTSQGGGLNQQTIIAGLKEALEIGSDNAVKQLSSAGGFNKNKLLRIGMPKELNKVTDTIRSIGLGFMVDNFEGKMNEAAEKASASAGPVFLNAIKNMTFDDAKKILNGPDTAATDYFKKNTSKELQKLYLPIVKEKMAEVGAVKMYNNLMDKYDAIPLKSKPKFNLESYVTDKALDGMFSVMADEEKKIRKDPVARTTELLKKVFGGQ